VVAHSVLGSVHPIIRDLVVCVNSLRERIIRFFLTLNAKNLIKDTQPRTLMSGAKSDVTGESIDEERNEESARQEETCGEEEVGRAAR
jgi:hypothetical protein